MAAAKAPWKRGNPVKKKARKSLTPAQKARAKRAAKKAGRPYPNLVDNMRVAGEKGGGTSAKKTASRSRKKSTKTSTSATAGKAAKKTTKRTTGRSAAKPAKNKAGGAPRKAAKPRTAGKRGKATPE